MDQDQPWFLALEEARLDELAGPRVDGGSGLGAHECAVLVLFTGHVTVIRGNYAAYVVPHSRYRCVRNGRRAEGIDRIRLRP